jgi:hypothetical protein
VTKYLRIVIYHDTHNKDPYTEKLILDVIPNKREAASKAYSYAAKILGKRWMDGEHKVLANPYFAYLYAKNVIKNRWPEAEPIISSDSESSYLYARYVLKGPFKAAEENKNSGTIFRPNHWDLKFSYRYARHIMKKRLKPSIEKLMAETLWSADYAKYVVKGRWKNCEGAILKSTNYGTSGIKKYLSVLSEKEKVEFHNKIILEAMLSSPNYHNMNNAKRYIEEIEREKAKLERDERAKSNNAQNGSDQSLRIMTQ